MSISPICVNLNGRPGWDKNGTAPLRGQAPYTLSLGSIQIAGQIYNKKIQQNIGMKMKRGVHPVATKVGITNKGKINISDVPQKKSRSGGVWNVSPRGKHYGQQIVPSRNQEKARQKRLYTHPFGSLALTSTRPNLILALNLVLTLALITGLMTVPTVLLLTPEHAFK